MISNKKTYDLDQWKNRNFSFTEKCSLTWLISAPLADSQRPKKKKKKKKSSKIKFNFTFKFYLNFLFSAR